MNGFAKIGIVGTDDCEISQIGLSALPKVPQK